MPDVIAHDHFLIAAFLCLAAVDPKGVGGGEEAQTAVSGLDEEFLWQVFESRGGPGQSGQVGTFQTLKPHNFIQINVDLCRTENQNVMVQSEISQRLSEDI